MKPQIPRVIFYFLFFLATRQLYLDREISVAIEQSWAVCCDRPLSRRACARTLSRTLHCLAAQALGCVALARGAVAMRVGTVVRASAVCEPRRRALRLSGKSVATRNLCCDRAPLSRTRRVVRAPRALSLCTPPAHAGSNMCDRIFCRSWPCCDTKCFVATELIWLSQDLVAT